MNETQKLIGIIALAAVCILLLSSCNDGTDTEKCIISYCRAEAGYNGYCDTHQYIAAEDHYNGHRDE